MPKQATQTKEAPERKDEKKQAEAQLPARKPNTMIEDFIEFQRTVPAIKKEGTGNYGKYATLDEIVNKARPILNGLGFALSQPVWTDEDGKTKMQTELQHKTGEVMRSGVLELNAEGVGMQKLGSAITYARRYQLGSFLGLVTDVDDDAQSAQDASEKAEAQGMVADKNARTQYVNFIKAVAQKLGLPIRPDLDSLTTPEMIKEAQDAKQKLQESQQTEGAANGGA